MMPKSDTITAIMQINRSARAEFLSAFSCDDLSCYLDRLSAVRPNQNGANRPASPSEAAMRDTPKDAPFRFTPDPARA